MEGKLVPNGDAQVVQKIFAWFAQGESIYGIGKKLKESGVQSPRGCELSAQEIRYFLRNESYVGDKHLQKKPPRDYLTHQPDPNVVYKDYYLTDDHEAVVSRELWNQVQARLAQREEDKKNGVFQPG